MDLKNKVCTHFRANCNIMVLVSDETYHVQTAVEEAVESLSAHPDREGRPVQIVFHDPLVGFHRGEFRVSHYGDDSLRCGVDQSLANIQALMDQDNPQVISGPGFSLAPVDDIICVLKGWESLLSPTEQQSPDFVQLFTNISQGNLCAAVWYDGEMTGAKNAITRERDGVTEYLARGRRMLVLVSRTSQINPALREFKPIHVPLPTFEDLAPTLDRHIAALKSRNDDKQYFRGVDDLPQFRDRVVRSLTGLNRSEADEALTLSMVDNGGFHDPGTFATIEEIKRSLVEQVPGVTYKPVVMTDESQGFLPGYQPIQSFIDESLGMDKAFALEHGIRPFSGIFLAGAPGTGKSVTSGQIARYLGLPELLWSLGESGGSLVSESERNARRVINTANALGAVLTLDDADKAGLGAGNTVTDGGVFQRVINIILTEMANPDSNITWVINANRIRDIRPELYRDGRVDERYFVDLPDAVCRRNILTYHVSKFKFPFEFLHGGKKLSQSAQEEAVSDLCSDAVTSGWSGAEIANLVLKAARRAAVAKSGLLDIRHMLEIAKERTPQSEQVSAKADYEQMMSDCSDFIRVGVSEAGQSIKKSISLKKRQTREVEVSR